MKYPPADSGRNAFLLEQWINDYGDAVSRTCFLYLADYSMAQDAMQDTFVKVWRSMGGGECISHGWRSKHYV